MSSQLGNVHRADALSFLVSISLTRTVLQPSNVQSPLQDRTLIEPPKEVFSADARSERAQSLDIHGEFPEGGFEQSVDRQDRLGLSGSIEASGVEKYFKPSQTSTPPSTSSLSLSPLSASQSTPGWPSTLAETPTSYNYGVSPPAASVEHQSGLFLSRAVPRMRTVYSRAMDLDPAPADLCQTLVAGILMPMAWGGTLTSLSSVLPHSSTAAATAPTAAPALPSANPHSDFPAFSGSGSVIYTPWQKLRHDFGELLQFTWDEKGFCNQAAMVAEYSADYLDNPNLTAAKNKTIINLPSHIVSILPAVRQGESERKEDLNEQFLLRHEWLGEYGISFSKIRSLKRKLFVIASQCLFEMTCVALAYVYLDKMILKGRVTKENRHLQAALALLTAVKILDPNPIEKLPELFEVVEDVLDVSKHSLLEHEFSFLASLNFDLTPRAPEIFPHFPPLMEKLNTTPEVYLVEEDWKDFEMAAGHV
eukprot:GCRY01006419.1.p1 GENE.GCRY01006419.1~~GCRY01006419.1.p1  ORF type:complete len:478 (+),score=105.72 GCRY01006419.1:280-1713(+)